MMVMKNSSTGNNNGGDDHNNDEKKSKKKITPIQIALLVERYLADNKYAATLSTFRAEAAEVFSKTKGKDTPKGLLSLADILDDYVSLKEHKLILDHDRKRLDLLLHTIHDAIRLYHHPNANINGTPPPHVSPASNGNYYNNNAHNNGNGNGGGGGSSPLSPPNYHQHQQQPPLLTPMTTTTPLATTTTTTTIHQRFQMGTIPPPISINANADNNVGSGSSPAGHAIQSLPFAKPAIPTPLHNIRGSSNTLAPTTNPSSRKKRKMIKQLPQAPPAPKKSRAASEALVIGGIRLPSQVSAGDTSLEVAEVTPISQPSPCNQLTTKPSIEVSSVAKSLFKLPADPHVKLSSPKTPPQESPSQSGESISPADNSQHSQSAIVNPSEQNAVSACSVISSKKIVVISPFKQSGYYSTKRSHCISTSPLKSPLKSSPSRLGVKRDHVKSRLNFDSEVSLSSEKFVEVQTSSSNEEKIQDDIFDIELLDLEGDVSISELLLDFDLENDMNLLPEPSTSCGTDFTNWSGGDEARDGVIFLDSSSQGAKGVLSEKDMNVHSPDPVMSVKTITKCIAIASPVKNGSISPVEQVDSEGTA